uniref:Gustatory receptor n=1 Tax=Anopheles atroparvus TaxID=41427 RepID=A0A182IJC1_ANOAO
MGQVQRSIGRLLRAGQLFGVVPWNVKLGAGNVLDRGSFVGHVVRVANIFYSLGIILAVCIATGFHYYTFISSDFIAIRTLNISEDVTVNFIVMVSIIGCQFLRPFYTKFTTTIVTVGDELAAGGGTIDFHRIETIVQRALLGALLYFGAILVFDFLNGAAWPFRFLYRTVLYTLPNVINVLALYQYVVALGFVHTFYRTVNKRLMVLERNVSAADRRGNRTKVPATITGDVIAYDHHVALVEALRRTHLKISNLTGEVNDRFGALLVLTMLSSFVVLSLKLFELYRLMTIVRWSAATCILLLYTVLWIGLHVAKVLMVLYPCHVVQRERDRTGPMLYSFHHSFADNFLHNAVRPC